jgi:hypothetical protein
MILKTSDGAIWLGDKLTDRFTDVKYFVNSICDIKDVLFLTTDFRPTWTRNYWKINKQNRSNFIISERGNYYRYHHNQDLVFNDPLEEAYFLFSLEKAEVIERNTKNLKNILDKIYRGDADGLFKTSDLYDQDTHYDLVRLTDKQDKKLAIKTLDYYGYKIISRMIRKFTVSLFCKK